MMGASTAVVIGLAFLVPVVEREQARRLEYARRMCARCDEIAEEQYPEIAKAGKKLHPGVVKHLGNADRVEVLCLDPWPDEHWESLNRAVPDLAKQRPERLKGVEPFHGYTVVGLFEATDKDERERLRDFLGKAVHWNALRMAGRGDPHHGVRATSGKRTLEFTICFGHLVTVYEDGKCIGALGTEVITTPNPLSEFLEAQEKKPPAKK
jgi:hypothetical protein